MRLHRSGEGYTSRTWIMRHKLTNNFADSLQWGLTHSPSTCFDFSGSAFRLRRTTRQRKRHRKKNVQTNIPDNWQKLNEVLYLTSQSYKLRHYSFWDKILIRKKFRYYKVSVSVAPVNFHNPVNAPQKSRHHFLDILFEKLHCYLHVVL